MKLIDIDKLVSDYKSNNKNLSNVTWFELPDYEVKAIPIKWLRRIMTQQFVCAVNSNGAIHFISGSIARQVISSVIELWEKENE